SGQVPQHSALATVVGGRPFAARWNATASLPTAMAAMTLSGGRVSGGGVAGAGARTRGQDAVADGDKTAAGGVDTLAAAFPPQPGYMRGSEGNASSLFSAASTCSPLPPQPLSTAAMTWMSNPYVPYPVAGSNYSAATGLS